MKKINITLKECIMLSFFFDQYYWKDIELPSHLKDWKKFKQNNKTIALNIFLYHTILKK